VQRGLLAVAAAVTACDFPTATPRFESRFIVPLESTQLGVAELLPEGVTVAGGAFRIVVPATAAQRSLGQLCGAPCLLLNGQRVPKPAFADTFSLPIPLPGDVVGGMVTGGTANISVTHSLGFDPLRPAGSSTNGRLTLTLRSGGAVLGSATIDQAFPSGTQLTRSVSVAGAVADDTELVVALTSPAGEAVTINTSAAMSISVAATTVTASEARISVSDHPVTVQPVSLDLTGVDEGVRDRVRRGALVLAIANPFTVTGTLELRLQAVTSGADIRKPVPVGPGSTTQRVELTGSELKSLLGHAVVVTVTGPISQQSGPVTVRPDQALTLSPHLDLFLEIGA
jgi:hypothetical protein